MQPGDIATLVLLKEGRVYKKSDAVLEITRGLPWPWRSAGLLRIFPRLVRDRLYDFLARNRYEWFGRRDDPFAPEEETNERYF